MIYSEHTPGPWAMVEPVALDYRPPHIYGADRSSLVAVAEGGGPKRAITGAEARRNAFLIAAAPELLSALRDLVSACEGKTFGTVHELQRALPEARRAIAKADPPL